MKQTWLALLQIEIDSENGDASWRSAFKEVEPLVVAKELPHFRDTVQVLGFPWYPKMVNTGWGQLLFVTSERMRLVCKSWLISPLLMVILHCILIAVSVIFNTYCS